ncbi:hypothetical protein A4V12_29425 [Streptomyces noursei]|nr:hypothetical protein A4V12_29425 [Streptomyces noursei]
MPSRVRYARAAATRRSHAVARPAPGLRRGCRFRGRDAECAQLLPLRLDTGVALATGLGQFGAGGRALYDPRPGDPGRGDWTGDTP